MRYRWLYVPLMILAVLASCAGASAMEPVPASDSAKKTVTIVTSASRGEVRKYKVDFQLKTSQAGAADIAAVYFKIKHSYGSREGDELLPMEASLQEGRIIAQGQALEITPTIYPKLTVLLDSHFRINDVLGISGSRFAQGTPGINYGNLIILFYLVDADTPHAVGDSWQAKVKLPSMGQAYDIVNTLKGIETVDGVEAAKVSQQITGAADSHMKCTAESYFSLQNGKLLKSHAECEVDLPPDDTPADKSATSTRATAKIDIAVVK